MKAMAESPEAKKLIDALAADPTMQSKTQNDGANINLLPDLKNTVGKPQTRNSASIFETRPEQSLSANLLHELESKKVKELMMLQINQNSAKKRILGRNV